ncbi:MAG: alpha-amylase family glycosyl hydrolase [Fusobacteria bacterium]|nr:alpha-amylase family glycosyl hydrolase [Fusobacteriota bacterium]
MISKRVLIVMITTFILFEAGFSQDVRASRLPVVGDGKIRVKAVVHSENTPSYCIELSHNTYRVTIVVAKNDIGRASVVVNGKEVALKMIQGSSRDYYYGDITVASSSFNYYFKLYERGIILYVGKTLSSSPDIEPFSNSQDISSLNKNTWAKNRIFYYILLDRFRNGNTQNDGEVESWTGNYSLQGKNSRYGGDLIGVYEKSHYLKELGIDAVEISSPFYQEGSISGNTLDFRHISPEYGVSSESGDALTFDYKILVKSERVKKGINPNSLKDEFNTVNTYTTGSSTIFFPKVSNLLRGKSSSESLNLLISSSAVNGYGESLSPSSWGDTNSDRLFFATLKKLHEEGISVILNLNLSSVSNQFFAYQEALKEGPQSPYAKWFYFTDWKKCTAYSEKNEDIWNPYIQYFGNSSVGVKYSKGAKYRRRWIAQSEGKNAQEVHEIDAWNLENVESQKGELSDATVRLNTSSSEVAEYLINACLKWAKGSGTTYQVDGFSLDFPSQLNSEFLKNFISQMLAVQPDMYFVAGIDRTPNKISVMYHRDFDIPDMLNEYVNENTLSSTDLAHQMEIKNIMESASRKESDLYPIDSIYTARSFSMTINPEIGFGESVEEFMKISPTELSPIDSLARYKLYLALSILHSGNSELLYGSEWGEFGGMDNGSIKPMLWNDIEGREVETDNLSKYSSQSVGGNKNALQFPGDVEVDLVNQTIGYTPQSSSEIYVFIKKILAIHHKYEALFSEGSVKYISLGDPNIYIYQIKSKKATLLIVGNRGSAKPIALELEKNGLYKSELNLKSYEIKEGKLNLELAKNGIDVLYKVY